MEIKSNKINEIPEKRYSRVMSSKYSKNSDNRRCINNKRNSGSGKMHGSISRITPINNNNISNKENILSNSKSQLNNLTNSLHKKEEKVKIQFGEKNPKLIDNKNFSNNKIVTTKYNLITWAPKSLLIQFRRAANIYFLLVAILTSMYFSPKQPGSMIGTFCLVLAATMLKEGIEDYYRSIQDRQANNRIVSKLVNGQWTEVLCWTLYPGDVIKANKEEELCSDILIIKSTNENGYCYIDTKYLDGETNLKEKCSLEEFKKIDEENISKLQFYIDVEKPNENLTSWKGIIEYEDKEAHFCSLANLILKGSVLKNTKYVIGLVIYCGKDTKIMKNSKAPRMKMSKVLVTMNRLLYSLFIFQISLCLTFAIFSTNWSNSFSYKYSYILSCNNTECNSQMYIVKIVINFLTFFVAYSHMIPISLYVALEIVKIIQGLLIKYDNEIYDFGIDKPAICRSTDLIEELGQVEFIFSDKTGTLTQNSMILKKVYINGKVYGSMQDEHPETQHSINGDMSIFKKLKISNNEIQTPQNNLNNENKSNFEKSINNKDAILSDNSKNKNNNNNNIKTFSQQAAFMMNKLNINKKNTDEENFNSNNNNTFNNLVEQGNFLKIDQIKESKNNVNKKDNSILNTNNNAYKDNNKVLINSEELKLSNIDRGKNINSISNIKYSIIPFAATIADIELDKKVLINFFYLLTLCHSCFPEKNKEGKIIYQGASPDDIALIKGAQQMGFEYCEKEFSEMTIKNHIYNNEKKFDLKVELPFDSDRKRMSVIVKNKENKNYLLLSKGADTTMLSRMNLDLIELEEINRVIKVLSKEGLRVLVIGSRQLSEKEYNSWFKIYSEDRNNGKDLNKLYERIECNINFMGLTAIEDKLQDGVPDTIYTLLTCNIRVWVLTGDKQDTAEEIAKSCKLINENMSIIYLLNDANGKSPKQKLLELIEKYGLKPEIRQGKFNSKKSDIKREKCDFNKINENTNKKVSEQEIIQSGNINQGSKINKYENNSCIFNNKINSEFFDLVKESKILKIKKDLSESKKLVNYKSENERRSSYNNAFIDDEIFFEEIIDLEYITKKIRKKEGKDISLIIDGVTLEEILQDKKLSYLFFKISIAAKSVICCRVSPKQKSKVVQLVKKYGKWVTLSIGDGANDVPMIMEAHIGVGIQGKEGTQAVRSADFSVGQFRFLEKLLLIYGRIGYMKISKFICYYFYKNIILVFTEIFFAFSNGFSGQIYFVDYLSTLYNALFTSWPCVLTFSFEKDLDLAIIKKFPILYVAGQKNYFFNLKIFWGYILYAIFHGFICFYVPNLGLLNSNNESGITFNHWYKSTTSFSLVIAIVTFKLMVISDFWNGLNIFSTIISIILYYIILIIFSFKPISILFQNELAGLIFNLFSYPKFWLVIIMAPFLALLPDLTFKQIFYSIYPTPTEYIKQYLKDKQFLNMVFNDENQRFILNSDEAREAEKRLQEILKKARVQKLKKKLVDKKSLEISNIAFNKFSKKMNSYEENNEGLLGIHKNTKMNRRKKIYSKKQINRTSNYSNKDPVTNNDLCSQSLNNDYDDNYNSNRTKKKTKFENNIQTGNEDSCDNIFINYQTKSYSDEEYENENMKISEENYEYEEELSRNPNSYSNNSSRNTNNENNEYNCSINDKENNTYTNNSLSIDKDSNRNSESYSKSIKSSQNQNNEKNSFRRIGKESIFKRKINLSNQSPNSHRISNQSSVNNKDIDYKDLHNKDVNEDQKKKFIRRQTNCIFEEIKNKYYKKKSKKTKYNMNNENSFNSSRTSNSSENFENSYLNLNIEENIEKEIKKNKTLINQNPMEDFIISNSRINKIVYPIEENKYNNFEMKDGKIDRLNSKRSNISNLINDKRNFVNITEKDNYVNNTENLFQDK